MEVKVGTCVNNRNLRFQYSIPFHQSRHPHVRRVFRIMLQESITCICVMQLKVDVQLYVKHNHEKIAYRAEGWSAQHKRRRDHVDHYISLEGSS